MELKYRPATNPGIRTCGDRSVPANVYFQVRLLNYLLWLRDTAKLYLAELGGQTLPDPVVQEMAKSKAEYVEEYGPLHLVQPLPRYSSGAYGLWQTV